MENASKALIMAAEILIALLIIALLVFGFTQLSNLSKTKQGTIDSEQLAEFNKQYESYNRKLIRGVDVISLINRAIDNNKKYDNEELYNITIQFELIEDLKPYIIVNEWNKEKRRYEKVVKIDETVSNMSLKKDKQYIISKKEDDPYKILFDRNLTHEETFNDFKRRIFDCTNVSYNDLGRVSQMCFKERKQDLTQGVIE